MVRSVDVMEALGRVFAALRGRTMPVSDVGITIYRELAAVPEYAVAPKARREPQVITGQIQRQAERIVMGFRHNAHDVFIFNKGELTIIGEQLIQHIARELAGVVDTYLAREAAAIAEVQRQMEADRAGCTFKIGLTTCGYAKSDHYRANGESMNHEFTVDSDDHQRASGHSSLTVKDGHIVTPGGKKFRIEEANNI
jgi:hypothetical protein